MNPPSTAMGPIATASATLIAELVGPSFWKLWAVEEINGQTCIKQRLKVSLGTAAPFTGEHLRSLAAQMVERLNRIDLGRLVLIVDAPEKSAPGSWLLERPDPVPCTLIPTALAVSEAAKTNGHPLLLIDSSGRGRCALLRPAQDSLPRDEFLRGITLCELLSGSVHCARRHEDALIEHLRPTVEFPSLVEACAQALCQGERESLRFPNDAPVGTSRAALFEFRSLMAAAWLVRCDKVICKGDFFQEPARAAALFETLNELSNGCGSHLADVQYLSDNAFVTGVLHCVRKVSGSTGHLSQSRVPSRMALRVTAARQVSYEVVHSPRYVFDLEEGTLARLADGRDVLLVVDDQVQKLFGKDIVRYANGRLSVAGQVIIKGTESQKSWAQVERICSEAVRLSLSRDGLIVGVGGGSALDVAGMAAALFRRGVGYIRIPTTLVGMVDVCVGIKHAINFQGKKSMLGAFYPPACGINDLTLLRTLPEREIACGISEIIKIAMVRDEILFATLEEHVGSLLKWRFQQPEEIARRVVFTAERLMIEELAPNLFESCRSRLVDFGHTFSPKLEVATRFAMPHGQAVAIDMALSAALSVGGGLCDPEVLYRLVRLYRAVGLPFTQKILTAKDLVGCLSDARKQRGGALNLVVPLSLGRATFLQEVHLEEIIASLELLEALHSQPKTIYAGTVV